MNVRNDARLTEQDILEVLEKEPLLTQQGFGIAPPIQDLEEYVEKIKRSQEALLTERDACQRACEWLAPILKSSEINPWSSSAMLCQKATNRLGKTISHGAFICAAIVVGFEYQVCDSRCYFQMDERSLWGRIGDVCDDEFDPLDILIPTHSIGSPQARQISWLPDQSAERMLF